MHTTWSDGVHTLEEMVMAAREKGYDYIAITDHSKSLVISHGLSEERLLQQQQVIEQLNSEIEGITILSGTEVDILNNKELDFDDRVLADLDVVVASIHSGFKQSKELLTERLLAAIDNKNVDIIGHPTGRLLGRRDPYPLDIDRVLEAAERNKTAMEINASPDRLDLKDVYIKKGKELGAVFAINTDAHHVNSLDDMQYGVKTARRGWLEKDEAINTFDLKKLKAWLKHR
jgi:DNA polymerase (family 10)